MTHGTVIPTQPCSIISFHKCALWKQDAWCYERLTQGLPLSSGVVGRILQMLPQHEEGLLTALAQGYVGSTPLCALGKCDGAGGGWNDVGCRVVATKKMNWVCYILRCADGTLYCGITNDPGHNDLPRITQGKGQNIHGAVPRWTWPIANRMQTNLLR